MFGSCKEPLRDPPQKDGLTFATCSAGTPSARRRHPRLPGSFPASGEISRDFPHASGIMTLPGLMMDPYARRLGLFDATGIGPIEIMTCEMIVSANG